MALESGLYEVVQGSFDQGNATFGETAGIRCPCMALFAISYSTLNEVNRWDQFDLDIILICGDSLYKSSLRQILLTVEGLPRDFKMSEETVFAQFRENKYGIFNRGLQEVHAILSENLVQNHVFCNNTIQFSLLYFRFAQS